MEPTNELKLVCLSDRILVTVNYEKNPAVITKTARENQMLEEIKRVLRKCDRKFQGKFHLFFSTPRDDKTSALRSRAGKKLVKPAYINLNRNENLKKGI